MKEVIERLTSRKFIGFAAATALLIGKFIDSREWLIAFGIYVGINVWEKIRMDGSNKKKEK